MIATFANISKGFARIQRIILEINDMINEFYYYKWGLISVLSNYEGHIKDTKRTRGRLDRNVAPCSRPTTSVIGPPWMQGSVFMHKNSAQIRHSRMNQARLEEEENGRKRDRKDRGQEADGKRGSPTKQKPI